MRPFTARDAVHERLRREWEREQAQVARANRKEVLASIDAKLDRAREVRIKREKGKK